MVTGAGSGLGRAYALELARRGASVVVNDIGESADAVVAEIEVAGGTAVANRDSVATRVGGQAMVGAALERFGRLDILIANAGILRQARFEDMSEDDITSVIDVHLKGAFYVGQPAFAAMKRQRYGRILLTASSSGLFGHPWQASYAAAKAGIVGLANVIALEGHAHGVLCNVIMPNARTAMANSVDFAWTEETPGVAKALRGLMELSGGEDRLHPSWVAPLACYLVSEACADTHGVYSACSGRYARVAIGTGEGWLAPGCPSLESVASNWAAVGGLGTLYEPQSVYDEALAVRRELQKLEDLT